MILDFNVGKLNIGLLVVRVLIGILFVVHGIPKLFGGIDVWNFVGSSMGFLGIKGGYAFWGLMAALAEFGGGILLIIGLFVRPASVFLFLTMIVAIVFHFAKKDSFDVSSHAMEDAAIFICFIITGGGEFSLDTMLTRRNRNSASLKIAP